MITLYIFLLHIGRKDVHIRTLKTCQVVIGSIDAAKNTTQKMNLLFFMRMLIIELWLNYLSTDKFVHSIFFQQICFRPVCGFFCLFVKTWGLKRGELHIPFRDWINMERKLKGNWRTTEMTKMRRDTKMIYVWTIKKEESSRPYLLNLTFLCVLFVLFSLAAKKRLIIVRQSYIFFLKKVPVQVGILDAWTVWIWKNQFQEKKNIIKRKKEKKTRLPQLVFMNVQAKFFMLHNVNHSWQNTFYFGSKVFGIYLVKKS